MKRLFLSIATLLLSACAQTTAQPVGYGHDALPSAEVIAFERVQARLGYAAARIEHDAAGCPVYQGLAPDGTEHREPLLDAAGQPICKRR